MATGVLADLKSMLSGSPVASLFDENEMAKDAIARLKIWQGEAIRRHEAKADIYDKVFEEQLLNCLRVRDDARGLVLSEMVPIGNRLRLEIEGIIESVLNTKERTFFSTFLRRIWRSRS
jgi:hypothetical protein